MAGFGNNYPALACWVKETSPTPQALAVFTWTLHSPLSPATSVLSPPWWLSHLQQVLKPPVTARPGFPLGCVIYGQHPALRQWEVSGGWKGQRTGFQRER